MVFGLEFIALSEREILHIKAEMPYVPKPRESCGLTNHPELEAVRAGCPSLSAHRKPETKPPEILGERPRLC